MHVDHSLGEAGQERGREQLHVARQHHQPDPAFLQPVGQRGVPGLAVGRGLAGEDRHFHARGPRALQRGRVGPVGGDADHLDSLAAVDPVEDRLEVRARAGGENAEAQPGPAAFPRPGHARASLGKRPPVERSAPPSSSASTRASTSSRPRWAKAP